MQMHAMLLEEVGKDLVSREIPVPEPGFGEILVKVLACGVCATDIKVASGALDSQGLPRILGHEPIGEIVKLGEGVSGFAVGDRIVSSTYVTCGRCKYCRQGRESLCPNVTGRIGITCDGGFAEYMIIFADNAVRVPDSVGNEACILACAAGVSMHALNGRIHVRPQDRVVIVGAGGVGIHSVQMASIMGAEVIAVDIDEKKLNLAKKYGANHVINVRQENYAEALKKLGGANIIMDTVGFPASITESIDLIDPGGKMVLVAYGPGKMLETPLSTIVNKEVEIITSRGVTNLELRNLLRLVENGKFIPVIEEEYPLDKINDVFTGLKENKISARAVVTPWNILP